MKELILQLGETMHVHTRNREAGEVTGTISCEALQATMRSLFFVCLFVVFWAVLHGLAWLVGS